MRKQSVILVMALCAAAAQSDLNFTVGGTPVRIGEDQETVLSRLRQTYQVRPGPQKIAAEDSFIIAEKDAAARNKIGLVTFAGGHLASAGFTWGETFDSDTVKFAKQLVAAIGNQEIAGPRTVILRPIQTDNTAASGMGFELLIGHRTIEVMTSQATENGKSSAQYASIMETLHDDAYVAALKRSSAPR